MEKQTSKFTKTAHLFAHRKTGAQKRFEKMYAALAEEIKTAWTADLVKMEAEYASISKSNQALATTKLKRAKQQAATVARETIQTVFRDWRVELDRIVSELGGYPQPDGMVLFPDGSTAKMPKGLFIPIEQLLRFE